MQNAKQNINAKCKAKHSCKMQSKTLKKNAIDKLLEISLQITLIALRKPEFPKHMKSPETRKKIFQQIILKRNHCRTVKT